MTRIALVPIAAMPLLPAVTTGHPEQQADTRATTPELSFQSVVAIAIRGHDGQFRAQFGPTVAPIASSGTGFAVAPGVFLTNRHVVDGITDALPEPRISLTTWAHGEHHTGPASLLAVSEDDNVDLAVIQSADLTLREVPWLAVRCDPPTSGRDYLVRATAAVPIGEGTRVDSLVSTRMFRKIHITTTILDLPVRHMILFEPETMAGNSGSPILDVASFGSFAEGALGVVRANVLLKGWQGVGEAVPGKEAIRFLRENQIPHSVAGDETLC